MLTAVCLMCVWCMCRPLYSSFSSPFSETPTRREPEYKLPACYLFPTPLTAQSAAAKTVHFTDETLFYMFYAMPQDFMQLSSANELYARKRLVAWDTHIHRELERYVFHRSVVTVGCWSPVVNSPCSSPFAATDPIPLSCGVGTDESGGTTRMPSSG